MDGEEVEADAVVIAMGPWSGHAAKWLPVPEITGQKYASIVLRPEEDISNHTLFLSYKTSSGDNQYQHVTTAYKCMCMVQTAMLSMAQAQVRSKFG